MFPVQHLRWENFVALLGGTKCFSVMPSDRILNRRRMIMYVSSVVINIYTAWSTRLIFITTWLQPISRNNFATSRGADIMTDVISDWRPETKFNSKWCSFVILYIQRYVLYSTTSDAFRLGLGLLLLLYLIYPPPSLREDFRGEPKFTGAKVGKIVRARATILPLYPGSKKFKIPFVFGDAIYFV